MKKIIILIVTIIFIVMLPSIVSLVVGPQGTADYPEFTIEDAVEASVMLQCADPNGVQWHGSGTIISGSGIILTARHILESATSIVAITYSGEEIPVTDLFISTTYDVGFCRLTKQPNIRPASLARHAPYILDEVRVVGTPIERKLLGTVTRGVVSCRYRKTDRGVFLQTDAGIYGGNSGGAVLNSKNKIIGITVSWRAGTHFVFDVPLCHIRPEYRHYCELWGK